MNGKTILSNMMWRFAERVGAQLVQLIVSIVLARILSPDDYGLIAIVNIFIGLLEIFIDNGLGNSLIQKKSADEIDFSTVFYTNILLCLMLYVCIWFLSPVIASFYNEDLLIRVLRVTSLLIIISSIKNIQQAYVTKKLLFRKFFVATFLGTVIAGIIGIWMAISGYGVWALVAQKLVNYTIDTIILWFTVKWRPVRKFSFEGLKALFSYGWKLLLSSLINQLMCDLRQLIVGKCYSSRDLALYNRGDQFPSILMVNITSSVDSVLFPVLSSIQDNELKVKETVTKSISISEFVIMPMLIGLVFCSRHVVGVLLTHKWDDCVPYIVILSISYLFSPIYLSCTNAIKAVGRSDIFLRFKVVQNAFSLISVIALLRTGPLAIAISLLLTNIFGQVYSIILANKYINYNLFDVVSGNYKTIIASVIMALFVMFPGIVIQNDYFALFIQVIVGIAVYTVMSISLKNEALQYLWRIIFHKKR